MRMRLGYAIKAIRKKRKSMVGKTGMGNQISESRMVKKLLMIMWNDFKNKRGVKSFEYLEIQHMFLKIKLLT